ncbi:hypothetical protein PAPYR_11287 [Paratrimastix pyriformis]|uniref:Kringle domain-containing protein n=1 Tax=Paratrimastix pyriformis TaxID=342808 RepID=A0ABQ8U416_9EUKA|nr:hypothetical protein PAPYR_11287 [Paratrimastix pyriformis]
MFGCGARGYTNTGKNWCYALEGLAPVHAPNSTPARQGCLHRFTGAGRRLVTKEPRARGENPPGICEARCLSRLRRALRFSRRVPLARAMPERVLSLFYVHPPGRVATRLRRCLGFAWLIMNLSSSFSLKPSGAVTPSWIVYCVARY